MRIGSGLLVFATSLIIASAVHAQTTKESAPMEPPYTKDTEFDPLAGEDPSATQIPSSNDPTVQQPAQKPATKPPVELKAGSSEPDPFANETAAPSQPPAKSSTATTTTSATDAAAQELTHSKTGVRMVHHPDAANGLIRIERDGTYVYQIKTTPKNQTGILRFGEMSAPQIVSTGNLINFQQMYGPSLFTLMGDYEWHPFSSFGKQLGFNVSVGMATAQGHGAFVSGGNDPPPLEKYTFFAVPLNAGLVYRLEYFHRQWVAPYLTGGGGYIGMAELRDDNTHHFGGTFDLYGGGGLMFNLSAMDKDIAFAMDSEYGIGTLWVIAEYRQIQALSSDLNFSGGLISLGFGADF